MCRPIKNNKNNKKNRGEYLAVGCPGAAQKNPGKKVCFTQCYWMWVFD